MQRLPVVAHLPAEEVGRCYRTCPDPKEKTRWHLIWLLLRPGEPPIKLERAIQPTAYACHAPLASFRALLVWCAAALASRKKGIACVRLSVLDKLFSLSRLSPENARDGTTHVLSELWT